MIEAKGLTQALRRQARRGPAELHGATGRRHWLPRTERFGQVDDDANDHGSRRADAGDVTVKGKHFKTALAASRGRRAAGGQGDPPRRSARATCGCSPRRITSPMTARRRGARTRRTHLGRRQARRQVLLGHGSATRHRRRAPRRSRDPALRRAGERPRPRRHPLGPQPAEGTGARGPDGLRLESPHERDGAHRRRGRHHRQGQADLPDLDRRAARAEHRELRAGALARGREAEDRARDRRARTSPSKTTARCRFAGPTRSPSANWRRRFRSSCTNSRRSRPRSKRRSWNSPKTASNTTARSRLAQPTRRERSREHQCTTSTNGATSRCPTGRYSFADLVRSEWTKIRTVRSTMWTIGVTIVLGIGIGGARHRGDPRALVQHETWQSADFRPDGHEPHRSVVRSVRRRRARRAGHERGVQHRDDSRDVQRRAKSDARLRAPRSSSSACWPSSSPR